MTKEQKKTINDIISNAEEEIKNKTGAEVKLVCRFINSLVTEDLKEMFEEMCLYWGVELSFVQDPSRKNDRPIMRKILWMAAKRRHPDCLFNVLCSLTNVKDHAGVIKGMQQGYNWLGIKDEKFMKYYNPVKEYFN